jgi:DNA polymerase III subunit epsilon
VSLFGSLFGSRTRTRAREKKIHALSADSSVAVSNWRQLAPADLGASLSEQRWLVVDVETSGLNTRLDRLLAIGAVQVDDTVIRFDHSFEMVIKQSTVSATDNILIHRIAGDEQRQGVDAPDALAAFLAFSKRLPCVAFHAPFDEAMLKRAFNEYLDIDFSPPFIDLALLAPALVREAPARFRSLDDWLDYFSIKILARHRAVADALGTAQLFQILLSRAKEQKICSADALFQLERDQRWLAKMDSP